MIWQGKLHSRARRNDAVVKLLCIAVDAVGGNGHIEVRRIFCNQAAAADSPSQAFDAVQHGSGQRFRTVKHLDAKAVFDLKRIGILVVAPGTEFVRR